MSAQPPKPPKFPNFQKSEEAKKSARRTEALHSALSRGKKRAPVIFLSAFVLVQCAPVLDRVFSPVMDSALLAAQPVQTIAYEFSVEPSGVIRATCAEGYSRIEVVPGEAIHTFEGVFRKVALKASLCTDFGFRQRQGTVYVPNELLRADSEVVQGAWETKTYTGVPSAQRSDDPSDDTMTLQVRKLAGGRLQISSVPTALEQPEFQPFRVTLGQPEDMGVVQNWRSGLLPLKDIRFEYEHAFLAKPLILQGKLMKIRPVAQ